MKTIFFLLTMLALCQMVISQKVAKGVVNANDNGKNTPLLGVNVFWKGTTDGTVTDGNGQFQLTSNSANSTLVFSFVGYKSDTVTAMWDVPMTVLLQADLQLQEVVVAKKRQGMTLNKISPFQVVNINQTELCKAACCNLAESFVTNPSVDVSYSDAVSGAKQIQMLGLAGVYSYLQTENLPNLRGVATSYGLAFVPGPWMESIQVSKGAASVVNGYESITGQVNVEYRKPSDKDAFFFNMYASDEKKMEVNAFVSSKVTEKWSQATMLHGRYYNSPADHNMDGFMDDPLTKQINLLHRWDRKSNNGSITRVGVQYIDESRVGGQMGYEDGMDHNPSNPYGVNIENRRLTGFIKNGIVFQNPNQSSVAVLGNVSSHRLRSMYGLNLYNADETSFYASLVYSSNLRSSEMHHITAGLSLNGAWFNETLNARSMDYQNIVPGIYTEYSFKPTPKLTWMTGLRADHHNFFGTFVTPRTHFRYNPSEHFVVRASAGKGYRHPAVWAENSNLLASARTLTVNNDRILEEAWNYGASGSYNIKTGNRFIEINAEYFRTDFMSQMVADMETDANTIYVNASNGKSYANSYQVDVRFEPLARLDVTMAMRINDVKQTIGGQLVEKPLSSSYKGLITLNYSDRLKKWMFDFNTQFIGDGRIPQVPSVPNEYQVAERYDAYQILNAQVTRFFRNGSVYLGCENLTDFTQMHPIVGADDPYGSYFDATRVWGPVMGRMFYMGVRYAVGKKG